MTSGMRIDSFVEFIDSVPSLHLFVAAVVTSVIFSVLLLNSGGGSNSAAAMTDRAAKIPADDVNARVAQEKILNQSSPRLSAVPEPQWHILKLLNLIAVPAFISSVLYFATDATRFLSDSTSLLRFIIGWSVFLCYFFGFFGISFVDADGLMARDREEEEVAVIVRQQLRQQQELVTLQPTKSKSSKGEVHPPACSAPVCSDPASVKPTKSASLLSSNIKEKSDEEIATMVLTNQIKDHQLEKLLDCNRAVIVRRLAFDSKLGSLNRRGALEDLPSGPSLDYSRVFGANCEIVVGYVPLPVGMVGPLTLNGETVYIPMATTEGCLVASTNRGCKAISQGTGASSSIVRDGITRAPCVRMKSAQEAANLKLWCEQSDNFAQLKEAFESTTNFGKLLNCKPTVAGKNIYIRLQCFSGDAMGMNMVSKGSLAVVELLKSVFPTLELVALSGNMCTDKKASATNWIEGRGKSVVVEATIPASVVKSTLKTDVKTIVHVNTQKNLIGSAMAASIGGFNAHASNIVTAIFLATGQDPAQNVESSNCLTLLEETLVGDLWISCTMPSIEVGTVGGGTSLPAQAACLKAIGCKGGGDTPGQNAKQLAHVVASATMAGELSLLAALAANTLVQAHMTHNRKPAQ